MRMTEEEVAQHPLIQRFYKVSESDEHGNAAINRVEFLSLMRREYAIMIQLMSNVRRTFVQDKHHKNIDRIDGLTKAITLLKQRFESVDELYRTLYPSAPDVLDVCVRQTPATMFECSCGDFTSIESEVDRHIVTMKMLEDVNTHSKMIPVNTIEEVN
jgi:hypothetical protein